LIAGIRYGFFAMFMQSPHIDAFVWSKSRLRAVHADIPDIYRKDIAHDAISLIDCMQTPFVRQKMLTIYPKDTRSDFVPLCTSFRIFLHSGTHRRHTES
jgi:hypothetical protein